MKQTTNYAIDSKRILSGFILASLLLIVAGAFAWNSISQKFDTVDQYAHNAQILSSMDKIKLFEQSYINLPSPTTTNKILEEISHAKKLADITPTIEKNRIERLLDEYAQEYKEFVTTDLLATSIRSRMFQTAEAVSEQIHSVQSQHSKQVETGIEACLLIRSPLRMLGHFWQ